MTTFYRYIETPVGRVWVAWCERGLVSVGFAQQRRGAQLDPAWKSDPQLVCDGILQLDEYFAGRRRRFDLPIVYEGTPFQERVWRELARIPYGETTHYGEIASRLGRPGASRAVGAANGQNRIAIVLPCHRVIGKNGKLTGFAGGLDIKDRLLRFERGEGFGRPAQHSALEP